MTSYSISDPSRPWVVLFSSSSIDELAEAIGAQPGIERSAVYATLDGEPRSLTAAEEIRLYERVLEFKPAHAVALASLAAVRREAPGR